MPSKRDDIREGGRWRLTQKAKNDGIAALVALVLLLARWLPRRAFQPLGRALGACASSLLARARRIALQNVARVFPDLDEPARRHFVSEVFRRLGENLTDTLLLLRAHEDVASTLAIDPASADVLDHALARGRGVIYITAHLGPWERMAALLASRGFPISTLARESYDPRFDRLYQRLRAPRQVQAIYRGKDTAALAIVRALARGRVVGFPVDLPGRVPVQAVSLLGQRAHLPIGPARIALRRRVPIVVGTPARTPSGGLEIIITEIAYDDLEADDTGARVLTQRFADAIGERIAKLPHHWPWMHPSFEAETATT